MKEKNYHNRDLKKRLWEQISEEMDITYIYAKIHSQIYMKCLPELLPLSTTV